MFASVAEDSPNPKAFLNWPIYSIYSPDIYISLSLSYRCIYLYSDALLQFRDNANAVCCSHKLLYYTIIKSFNSKTVSVLIFLYYPKENYMYRYHLVSLDLSVMHPLIATASNWSLICMFIFDYFLSPFLFFVACNSYTPRNLNFSPIQKQHFNPPSAFVYTLIQKLLPKSTEL